MTDSGAAPRGAFTFFGGHVALDLPATLTGRLKAVTRDLLARPEDLGHWLVAAARADAMPAVSAGDLVVARTLREAIYALALAAIDGKKFSASARRNLNEIAAAATAAPQLSADGSVLTRGSARALLAGVARAAIHLFGSAAVERIRQCEADICARLFLDTSRSGERRWCSMAGCGNKAKVAQFRRRQG